MREVAPEVCVCDAVAQTPVAVDGDTGNQIVDVLYDNRAADLAIPEWQSVNLPPAGDFPQFGCVFCEHRQCVVPAPAVALWRVGFVSVVVCDSAGAVIRDFGELAEYQRFAPVCEPHRFSFL